MALRADAGTSQEPIRCPTPQPLNTDQAAGVDGIAFRRGAGRASPISGSCIDSIRSHTYRSDHSGAGSATFGRQRSMIGSQTGKTTESEGSVSPRALQQSDEMQKSDGMNYAPEGKSRPVVGPGEFSVAAMALDHGHIYGMCNGLTEAGADINWVFDPDSKKVERFRRAFPMARAARSKDEILQADDVHLVASAAVPNLRGPLGCEVMSHGKDYFTDKAPMTTLRQLEQVKQTCSDTARKFAVYYSERLHTECSIYAGNLIDDGAIGRVLQVIGMGAAQVECSFKTQVVL